MSTITATNLHGDTIRKTGGSLGVDIRVKNTSVFESDGGTSVTQNLVQSLVKTWSFFDVETDDIHDSFNVASLTDNGTGDTTTAFTNSMSSINYVPMGGSTHDGGSYGCYMPLDHDSPPTTSNVNFDHMQPYAAGGTRVDQELCTIQVTGDLA